jgi:hypothetical protein
LTECTGRAARAALAAFEKRPALYEDGTFLGDLALLLAGHSETFSMGDVQQMAHAIDTAVLGPREPQT